MRSNHRFLLTAATASRRHRHGRWARRNRRRSRLPRIFALLVILAGEVVAVGLTDPRFNLKRIEVRGVNVLTPEQVVNHSGLLLGTNLFRVPVETVQQRLRTLPPVAEVRLNRRLPDRLVIWVRERQAVACVAAQNALFEVDAEGVVFRMDSSPPRGIPLVSGLEGETLRLGDRLPEKLTRTLNRCLAAGKKAMPTETIGRISIDPNGNLCLNRVTLAYEVRLGPPERLDDKLALLVALEQCLPEMRRNSEYVDLSCPEAPAWKPKSPSSIPLPLTAQAGAGKEGLHDPE